MADSQQHIPVTLANVASRSGNAASDPPVLTSRGHDEQFDSDRDRVAARGRIILGPSREFAPGQLQL